MKELLGVYHAPRGHWVGDGFPVRTLFSYDRLGKLLSPFLLLDYAGPQQFEPATKPRGVGEHPHRGFETVTIVYAGAVSHRDSAGNGGTIGPGDVQWMTAGGGVMHEEFHSPEFTGHGGLLKMAQLWVNLPAAKKLMAPRYQSIESRQIPQLPLSDGQGSLRVIAGHYRDVAGPAETNTEMNVWDLRLSDGQQVSLPCPAGHNTVLAVLGGAVRLSAAQELQDADIAVFAAAGQGVEVTAIGATTLLVLTGAPIDEPIVGYGPFVMNTRDEIVAAFNDLQSGKFGTLA